MSESDTRVHTLLQVCIGRGWGKVGASFKAPKCVRALCVADDTPGADVAIAMRNIHQAVTETYTCCSTEVECCQRTSCWTASCRLPCYCLALAVTCTFGFFCRQLVLDVQGTDDAVAQDEAALRTAPAADGGRRRCPGACLCVSFESHPFADDDSSPGACTHRPDQAVLPPKLPPQCKPAMINVVSASCLP